VGFVESRPRFAYLPIGGVPRRCIGERFAILELTRFAATVVQNYHLELTSDSNPVLKPPVTTRSDKPIRVRSRSR
jgi:cytochrome P450